MDLININALKDVIREMVEIQTEEKIAVLKSEIQLLKKSNKQVMTLEESAEYMGKSIHTVRKLLRDNSLPYSSEGKRKYLKTDDINEYLLANKTLSKTEIKRATDSYNLKRVMKIKRK